MIHKLYALKDHIPGEVIDRHNNRHGLNLDSKVWPVLVINIALKEDKAEFHDINKVDYSVQNNVDKFFYWSRTGFVVSAFPTIVVTADSLDISSDNEEQAEDTNSKSYAKLIRILKDNARINPRLEMVRDLFLSEGKEIFSNVREQIGGSKDTYLLTLCVNNEFIGESELYQEIRNRAEMEILADYHTLGKRKVTGQDQTCSLCGTRSPETWGYVSTYHFYASKTDLAPVAGKFDLSRAHICYPVCPACADILRRLKPVVDTHLDFKFCGLRYKLLPQAISGKGGEAQIAEIFEILIDENNPKNPKCGSFSLGADRSLIREQTQDIFHLLAESDSQMSYTMLFYLESNSEFKILSTVEDVFPSQFQDVFKAKAETDRHPIYRDNDLDFRFDVILEFFPLSDKIYGSYAKSFLEITRNVFTQKPLSWPFILHQVMYIIRKRFVRDEFYKPSVLKAFMMLEFMAGLGVINPKTKTTKEVSVNKVYEDFFQEHVAFFDSSDRKAAFLMGVLCQFLLNIQYQERKATPFQKKLNGLKMSPKLLTKLYGEIINKLTEYGKNYYTELEADIAKLLIQDREINLSDDELSFLFALGMRLHKLFKTPETPDAPDENQQEE